jgi:uncharacterized protein (DUF1684 family)
MMAGNAMMGRLGLALLLVFGMLAAGACTSPQPDDNSADYVAQLKADRAAKDNAFRTDANSPIPADQRTVLLPLNYFPPNPSYRVPAVLEPDPENIIIQVPTSTGQIRREQKYGTLKFFLNGQKLQLTAFVEEGSTNADRLFVPFMDKTSGKQTYGGGRYLDLDRTPTGLYLIDFNRAYSPYCLYSPTYDCPYPPPENRLPIPIDAGEKLPKSKLASNGQ